MASKSTTPTNGTPAVQEFDPDSVELALIQPGQRGRKAAPSIYADVVASAPHGKWFKVDGTTAYPVKVIERELRKAVKQYNADHETAPLSLSVRARDEEFLKAAAKSNPAAAGVTPFVGWMVEPGAAPAE